MRGRLRTLRVSKEKPGTTSRLDQLRDFVDGKGYQDVSVFSPIWHSHCRGSIIVIVFGSSEAAH